MQQLSDGIVLVDTHYLRPEVAAAYIIVQDGHAAVVETNTSRAVPRLLAALDALDLPVSAVDFVVVTHVHLDHAGGAGELMRHLPEAQLVVHSRGARHLIDPSRLIASATQVYGEATLSRLYGEIVPVPKNRVLVPVDGQVLGLAGRPLVCLDTPGHARHHLALLDEATRSVFTGDIVGLAYPALATPAGPFIFPTTSPPQLDPDAMRSSIARILAHDPSQLLLTHFGAVADPRRAADEILRLLDAWEALARTLAAPPDRRTALEAGLRASLWGRYRELGGTLDEASVDAWLELDVRINAQGWDVWLSQQDR